MVVGDTKQSIYRFRSGEAEQFARLPELIGEKDEILLSREKVLKDNYLLEDLNVNFRSRKDIVMFNNDFFEVLKGSMPQGYQQYYTGLKQDFNKEEKGYIRIHFIDGDNYEDLMLNQIHESILHCQEDGYMQKDMAILCRERKNASLIARYLIRNGVNVVSSESLLLSSSPEVNFLLSWLKYLDNPDYEVAAVSVLEFLEKREMLGRIREQGVFNIYYENKSKNGYVNLFDFLVQFDFDLKPGILKGTGLYDLVEELIRIFGLTSFSDPYLLSFLDVILEQVNSGREGISDFLSWWDENSHKQSIVLPEEIDAVRIMTIHKAKGLQFPVVIYPFADSRKRLTKNELWVNFRDHEVPGIKTGLLKTVKLLEQTDYEPLYREETEKSVMDMINMMYVVMTRASERMFILSRYEEKMEGGIDSVPKILKAYLENKGLWSDERLIYEFGERIAVSGEKKKLSDTESPLAEIKRQDWRNQLRISYNAPEFWDVRDPDRATRWGNLIHSLLSGIRSSGDLDKVVGEYELRGDLKKEDLEQAKSVISKLFSHPAIKKLFDTGERVLTESELITAKGESYRPDRILIGDGNARIIDFKTGNYSEKHEKQLREYGNLIRNMGYNITELILLYISDQPVIRRINL